MTSDTTAALITTMFNGLRRRHASSIPQPGALSSELTRIVTTTTGTSCAIDSSTLALFGTASVEMWQRSVHSFLISASLTSASPIWACVAGYYSSHYAIRAFAHLLGYFQLQSRRRILHVELSNGHYICNIVQKQAGDREHKFYWKTVKGHPPFADDPFFTRNDEGAERSDSAHRGWANYADHVNRFPQFRVLDEAFLKDRVEGIASIYCSDAPIPRMKSFPDTVNVQLVAYHRMVRYRSYLDERVGATNRFWKVHRNPHWCPSFLDFQVVEPKYAAIYRDHTR